MAIDKDCQGQKLGEYLLLDALHKSFKLEIAAFAVIAEAKNEQVVNFYKSYGFTHFIDNSNKLLYLLIQLQSYLFKRGARVNLVS